MKTKRPGACAPGRLAIAGGSPRFRSQQFVEDVFHQLLAAGGDDRLGVLLHPLGQVVEVAAAAFDPLADAAVPARVAGLDEVLDAAVGADGGGGFEAAGEGEWSSIPYEVDKQSLAEKPRWP